MRFDARIGVASEQPRSPTRRAPSIPFPEKLCVGGIFFHLRTARMPAAPLRRNPRGRSRHQASAVAETMI